MHLAKHRFPLIRISRWAACLAALTAWYARAQAPGDPQPAQSQAPSNSTTAASAAAAAAESAIPPSSTDKAVRLDEMEVFSTKTSAETQAMTESPIDALEPQSFISAETINNTLAPTADYATIANIAASVVNVETEGPGLSEAKLTQMRGFADGQYNVTYDGIPFGDVNGATHHTTSYFPAKVLGGEVIDRGPGTAATIGENTFGGTIALLSKDPRPDQAVVMTLSDGSYNTFLGNVEVNTGNLPQANGASLVATYQYLSSNGYRTFSYENRNTYYLKYLQPLSPYTVLTVVGNYNNIRFNNPGAVTWAQIEQFGRNYGLDDNPFDPNNNYYPYNYQAKQADMEYIGLDSTLPSGWAVDDKAYTYAYNNDSHENSSDPVVGGTTKFPGTGYTGPSYTNDSSNTLPGTGEGAGLQQDDDPGGRIKVNAYRVFGDYLSVAHGVDTPFEEKVGLWGEYVRAVRYAYDLDYSPAYAAANPQDLYTFGYFDPASNYKNNTYQPGYEWFMHLYNKTFQPYADFIWKPVPNLTIEAGVKDSNYTIDLEAPVNQTDLPPDFNNYTYTKVLPLVSINYLITPVWSVYAQAAEGVAYPIVTDEENIANDSKDVGSGETPYNPAELKEETTNNYQVGTVYKTDKFNADADVYLIDINNLVSSVTDPSDPNNTIYFGSKGAWVSGLEAEGTYYVGGGLSLVANGSLNRAVFKTDPGVPHFNVANLGTFGAGYVPNSTGFIGAVFNRLGWFGSIEDKYVGPGVEYSSALSQPDLGLYGQGSAVRQVEQGGFSMMQIAGGYAYALPQGYWVHSIKLKLEVDNALNRDVQVYDSVGSSVAKDTFDVLPTRSYFATLSFEF